MRENLVLCAVGFYMLFPCHDIELSSFSPNSSGIFLCPSFFWEREGEGTSEQRVGERERGKKRGERGGRLTGSTAPAHLKRGSNSYMWYYDLSWSHMLNLITHPEARLCLLWRKVPPGLPNLFLHCSKDTKRDMSAFLFFLVLYLGEERFLHLTSIGSHLSCLL